MKNPTLETYANPDNYDLESGPFDPDGTILLDLAIQAAGPVLELGCGTGRVTIPSRPAWNRYHRAGYPAPDDRLCPKESI